MKNPHSEFTVHRLSEIEKSTETRQTKWNRFQWWIYFWTWKTTDISQSYTVSVRHDHTMWTVPRATPWLL